MNNALKTIVIDGQDGHRYQSDIRINPNEFVRADQDRTWYVMNIGDGLPFDVACGFASQLLEFVTAKYLEVKASGKNPVSIDPPALKNIVIRRGGSHVRLDLLLHVWK